jgi:ketosteroid isomerase-like protein
MTVSDRVQVVRDVYGAYETGDRDVVERSLADDFIFFAPPYEATSTDARRFRNTEIFGFDGDMISRVEVYFGWDID